MSGIHVKTCQIKGYFVENKLTDYGYLLLGWYLITSSTLVTSCFQNLQFILFFSVRTYSLQLCSHRVERR